jgi:PAS domain S-box-containing protein
MTHELLKTELTGGVDELETKLARYGAWVGELRHTTRDGRQVHVEGRLALLSQHNGKWIVLEVNRDITDQRAAEKARHVLEQQLALLDSQRRSNRH